MVRLETPYLAVMQQRCRTPMLDTFFALAAMLGTHTFFMVGIPITFWCGYARLGRAFVVLWSRQISTAANQLLE